MKPYRIACIALCMSSTLLLPACSKAPPEPPPPAPSPTTFSIAETNTLVTPAELPQDGRVPLVKADFNFDQLADLAIAEKDKAGQNVVSIYLQRRGAQLPETYFKSGSIRQSGDYVISALMSQAQDGHTDLGVIFTFSGGRKELVHFRSDGKEFKEIMRKPLATAPAPPAP